jgi:putative transposase
VDTRCRVKERPSKNIGLIHLAGGVGHLLVVVLERVTGREDVGWGEHRRSRYLNNRAENSHQPTRQCERAMKGFRSVGGARRFLSAFSGIPPRFRPRRHLMPAAGYRAEMTVRFAIREQITGLATAA